MDKPKLYETINDGNWIKNWLRIGDRKCLVGHMIDMPTPEFEDRMERIKKTIKMLYPDRFRDATFYAATIGRFNDHRDTTVEDVIRVCKVADV